MKEKIINTLKTLIAEHEVNNYCTDIKEAERSIEQDIIEAFDKFYDVGRYEAFKDMLYTVQNL